MKTIEELKKLSKIKLEEYAREQGIELDRRKTKSHMITDFLEGNVDKASSEKKPEIIVKSPDEVIEEAKVEVAKAEGDQQYNDFKAFIDGVKSSDVGNPTMWMLGALGKHITGHKVKCVKDPETGKVIIESEGPSINGKFELK